MFLYVGLIGRAVSAGASVDVYGNSAIPNVYGVEAPNRARSYPVKGCSLDEATICSLTVVVFQDDM